MTALSTPLLDTWPWLTAPRLTAALLLLAWALGAWRSVRCLQGLRWRAGSVLLQGVLALALYFTLWPPLGAARDTSVWLASEGARAADIPAGVRLLALPEAPALAAAERVPDFNAARDRAAGAAITVVGWGLPARDRDAARGHVLSVHSAPLPRGIQSVQVPARMSAGATAWLHGRVAGVPGARLRLRDPAARVIADSTITADGHFALPLRVRAAGWTPFTLELLDARGARVQALAVPVTADTPVPLTLWLLAGAPNAEVNQWRRWAEAVGITVRLRAALGGGVVLASQPMPLTDAALAKVDVLLLDSRAWLALSTTEQRTIVTAVRAGLGLVLRVDGPLPAAVRASWQRAFGLDLRGDGSAVRVVPQAGDPSLIAWNVTLAGNEAVPLLHTRDGRTLAAWQVIGRGRVALFALDGSNARVLAGQGTRYADDASALIGAVARGSARAAPHLRDAGSAWRDERVIVCGLDAHARWQDPAGGLHPLAVSADGCGAFWPRTAGHVRVLGAAATQDLLVRDPRDAPALRAAELATASRAVLAAAAVAPATAAALPGARWPWFLLWLLGFAANGWLERRLQHRTRT